MTWKGTSHWNVSSFGGNNLKLFCIQFTFKILSVLKDPWKWKRTEIEDVRSTVSAKHSQADLGLTLPGAWKSSSHLGSWVRLSCAFFLDDSIAYCFYQTCSLQVPTIWVFRVIILILITIFIDHLLSARHYSKNFSCTNSFNPHTVL